MRYRRQIMKRFFGIFAAVVILAGCGGPSLPPLKDYTMNEISFKVYETWKLTEKEEGTLKMMFFMPELPWGSFAMMRYEGMSAKDVISNVKNSMPSSGNEFVAEYQVEINGAKFDFVDFKNGDKRIPLKFGSLGVADGTGYAGAIQIYSDFQGLDNENNTELKTLAETVVLK